MNEACVEPSTEPQTARGATLCPLTWGKFEASGFGTLWLRWSTIGLRELHFEGPTAPTTTLARFEEVPAIYADPLVRYFAGEREAFHSMPLDLLGTDFQLRVWKSLQKIPYGQVRTYGSIALDIGSPRAMRAVGAANGRNPLPIILPCHRVIAADDKLGGYSGGLERKRFLLELEGVRIQEGIVQPGQLGLFV